MRVVVADENASKLQHLANQLETLGCQIVAQVKHEGQLMDWPFLDVDVCFLDPTISPASGLELLKHLPGGLPVVLTCEKTDLAFAAYEAGAMDFLKKPVKGERLAKCLLRLSALARIPDPPKRARRGQRFPAKVGDGTLMIDLAKTTHFTFESHAVWAHAGGKFHTFWRSLAEVEEASPGSGLFRVQRNILILIDQIVGMRGAEQGRVKARLQGGIEIEVSRGASPKLKDRLGIP